MKKNKKVNQEPVDILACKAVYFSTHTSIRSRKKWYKKNCPGLYFRVRCHRVERILLKPKRLPKFLDFVRWVIVDISRFKPRKFWGIYQFVALPGEGKTLSMVAHMEREVKHWGKERIHIATNFFYAHEDRHINHWVDIIAAAKYARDKDMFCIIAIDEIHTTFDSSDWKSFPSEMLSLLSFNRKYHLQFLCSAQIYDRIPKKIRDIANYTVICENTWGLDRHFVNRYFTKEHYDTKFDGKRKNCDMIYTYIADDNLYSLYDTRAQVDRMSADAEKEKDKRQEAFEILFGGGEKEDETA